jgi:hypothetical protein
MLSGKLRKGGVVANEPLDGFGPMDFVLGLRHRSLGADCRFCACGSKQPTERSKMIGAEISN